MRGCGKCVASLLSTQINRCPLELNTSAAPPTQWPKQWKGRSLVRRAHPPRKIPEAGRFLFFALWEYTLAISTMASSWNAFRMNVIAPTPRIEPVALTPSLEPSHQHGVTTMFRLCSSASSLLSWPKLLVACPLSLILAVSKTFLGLLLQAV